MPKQPLALTPVDRRVKTKDVIVSTTHAYPRCAAETRDGFQCRGTVGSTGQGGGYAMVDGNKVPLCTKHRNMVPGEDWL